VVFDSLLYGHREFVRWGKLIEGDIRDGRALERVLASQKFDAVMHFAALAYVGESVADPDRYYDANVHGTRVLLSSLVHARVPAIVFSSSCAVYGQPDITPIREDTQRSPINPYGFTKYVCEQMLEDFGKAYGLTSARLRYFNAAGAEPSAEIGEDHDPETHLIPLVLDVALGLRPSVQIFGTDYPTPDGTALRDYIHVCDLARAHVLALELLLRDKRSLTFNIGSGRAYSVQEVVDAVRNVTGQPVLAKPAPRRIGDPAILVADASRAQEVLGWSAVRSDLRTIVADAWRWHSQRFGSRKNLSACD
jgi:UDP-glucose-4-epimerase GalE